MEKNFKATKCSKKLKKGFVSLIFAGVFIAMMFLVCGCSSKEPDKGLVSESTVLCYDGYNYSMKVDIDTDEAFLRIDGYRIEGENRFETVLYVPMNYVEYQYLFLFADEFEYNVPPCWVTVKEYSDGTFECKFDFISVEEYESIR